MCASHADVVPHELRTSGLIGIDEGQLGNDIILERGSEVSRLARIICDGDLRRGALVGVHDCRHGVGIRD